MFPTSWSAQGAINPIWVGSGLSTASMTPLDEEVFFGVDRPQKKEPPVLPVVLVPAGELHTGLAEWFRPLVSKRMFVAGGCFKQFLTGNPIRDIDIWFSDVNEHATMVHKLTLNPNYTKEYASDRSVGFRHNTENVLLDLVKLRFGTPVEIISEFDFTVCQMVYYVDDAGIPMIAHHPNFFIDLEKKQLDLDDSVKPILTADYTFNRMIKYVRDYGFTPSKNLKTWFFTKIKELNYVPTVSELDTFNRY
jgi:hypothetical protein